MSPSYASPLPTFKASILPNSFTAQLSSWETKSPQGNFLTSYMGTMNKLSSSHTQSWHVWTQLWCVLERRHPTLTLSHRRTRTLGLCTLGPVHRSQPCPCNMPPPTWPHSHGGSLAPTNNALSNLRPQMEVRWQQFFAAAKCLKPAPLDPPHNGQQQQESPPHNNPAGSPHNSPPTTQSRPWPQTRPSQTGWWHHLHRCGVHAHAGWPWPMLLCGIPPEWSNLPTKPMPNPPYPHQWPTIDRQTTVINHVQCTNNMSFNTETVNTSIVTDSLLREEPSKPPR